MIPVQFGYATPGALEEAIDLLRANDGARIIAGGLSLIGSLSARASTASLLVDLRKIPGLAEVTIAEDGGLVVGAMVSCAALLERPETRAGWPALAEALTTIGDPQVRNRATVGGSLADGDPSGDLPAAAIALGATVSVTGPRGTRIVPIEDLVATQRKAGLQRDEVITSVAFPAPSQNSASAYQKFKNPASGRAICGVAVCVEMGGNSVDRCVVALCGATAHTVRLPAVEAALVGREPSPEQIAAAAAAVGGEGLEFVTDLAASGEYRAHLAEVLAARAIRSAVERTGRS